MPPAGAPAPDSSPLRVLVVEDEPELRQLIAESLEADGFIVAQSTDAKDAIERLQGFAYDGLVTDLRLPDGDGMTVLDEALSRYPGMRCVVVTGFGAVRAPSLDGLPHVVRSRAARTERVTQLAFSAIGPALAMAGLATIDGDPRPMLGIVLGTAFGCFLNPLSGLFRQANRPLWHPTLSYTKGMAAALRDGVREHGIENVRVVQGRWPATAAVFMPLLMPTLLPYPLPMEGSPRP